MDPQARGLVHGAAEDTSLAARITRCSIGLRGGLRKCSSAIEFVLLALCWHTQTDVASDWPKFLLENVEAYFIYQVPPLRRNIPKIFGSKMKTVFDRAYPLPLFTMFKFAAAVLLSAQCALIHAAEKIDIKIADNRGLQQRIDARYEHDGTVVVDNAGQATKAEKLQMKTVADLVFHQRLTGSDKDPQAIRYYDSSYGNFNIHKGKSRASLQQENRLIVARLTSKPGRRLQMASVQDLLNQSELNLIKNPADPLTYAGLLSKQSVAQGDKWEVGKDALADFLAVDRILYTDAKMMLKTATATTARIYLLGQVDATVDDSGTSMKVSAVFDVNRTSKQVTEVRLSIDENRQAGQVAPGFEGKSRVNIQVRGDDGCKHLATDNLKKLTQSRRIKQRLQWKSDEGNFALEYDPRWKMIASEREAAVLRFVDDGDLLAQCNVVQLPARPASNPLTLAKYRKEIEAIIRPDKTAKLIGASEITTAKGDKAFRVSVKGIEEDVPVKWIYYHVAADDGRRLTFIFTLEQEIADVFQPSDQRMVNGLSFHLDQQSPPAPQVKVARKVEQTKRKTSTRRAGGTRRAAKSR